MHTRDRFPQQKSTPNESSTDKTATEQAFVRYGTRRCRARPSHLDSVPQDGDPPRLLAHELPEGLVAELGVDHHAVEDAEHHRRRLLVRGAVAETGEAVEVQQNQLTESKYFPSNPGNATKKKSTREKRGVQEMESSQCYERTSACAPNAAGNRSGRGLQHTLEGRAGQACVHDWLSSSRGNETPYSFVFSVSNTQHCRVLGPLVARDATHLGCSCTNCFTMPSASRRLSFVRYLSCTIAMPSGTWS